MRLSGILILLLAAGWAAADDTGAARRALAEEMATWIVVPKIHIGGNARFILQPDGFPTNDKQGVYRGWGASRQQRASRCASAGSRYRLRPVSVGTRAQEIHIGAFNCGALFVIELTRPLAASDLSPAAIRRALGGIFGFANAPGASAATALLNDALWPIEVDAGRTLYETIVFENPPEWEIRQRERQVFFDHRHHEIRVDSRSLKPEELTAGARLVLEESIPRKLLRSARKLDPDAVIDSIARVSATGELQVGSATVTYDGLHERHDWVFDREAARLYTIRGQTATRHSSNLQPFMSDLTRSVRSAQPNQLARKPEALPTPGDLFAEPGTALQSLALTASARTVAAGARLSVTATFDAHGDPAEVLLLQDDRKLYHDDRLVAASAVEQRRITPGGYESTHVQPVPATAAPGRYRYVARTCIDDTCRRRQLYLMVDSPLERSR